MLPSRWLQFLFSLGLEFWLPLPLLGLGFWGLSSVITEQILSHFNPIKHTVSVNTQQEVLFAENKIRSIQLEINERQGISKVTVKLTASALKELEFQFPVTELTQIEVALSQELGLSPQEIRKLISEQSEIYQSHTKVKIQLLSSCSIGENRPFDTSHPFKTSNEVGA